MILLLRFILFLAALSKTASFSIAGCQLDMGLSKAERDEICPPDYNLPHGTGNFGYIRHNVNKKNVSYMCNKRRGCVCDIVLHFKRCKDSGIVDFGAYSFDGTHSRTCFVANNPKLDPDDYPWDDEVEDFGIPYVRSVSLKMA
mmetsp:Transcript_14501/g.26289  ORF Transcript_14501/g.26289 Transcript_14501/m.26289 type:complete len:143 (+) Transcript_14501:131-559(+)